MNAESQVEAGPGPGLDTAPLQTPLRVRLIVITGKSAGQSIDVPGARFVIGREPGCQLRPNSQAISRRHASIEQREGRVYLRDLGTTNGTALNDHLLRGEELEVGHGDRLQVGPLLFTF